MTHFFFFFFSAYFLILEQMKNFFKLKQKHANLYEDLYPSSVIHVFEQELVKLVPTRDQNGTRILVIQCGSEYFILFIFCCYC